MDTVYLVHYLPLYHCSDIATFNMCQLTFSCAINIANSTASNVDSLLMALITKAKKITTNTDTEVFSQKPTETYRSLNCQHRNSI